MTNILSFFIIVILCNGGPTLSSKINPKMTTTEIVKGEGYPIEEHLAYTSDGYILKVHRMPRGRDAEAPSGLPPVLIIHGMIGSSGDFVLMGPKRSLAYLLADAGYDVFIGNLRFNLYASHVNLTKSDAKYWNFSIDEHGLIDVPAIMELTLAVSGASGFHYIGYSMGAATYMMICDKRPDLAAKVLSFIGLAPAVHMGNLAPMARLIFNLQLPKMLLSRGISMLSLGGRYQRTLAKELCSPRVQSEDLCFTLAFFLIGEDYDQIEWDLVPLVVSRVQPISVKEMVHYFQLTLTDKLYKYDYGPKKNMEVYGTKKPPIYDLSANKAPVALFYGSNDLLTAPSEIMAIANAYKKTNTLVYTKKVPWKKFNHYDFIVAKDIATLVNDEVVQVLNTITHAPKDDRFKKITLNYKNIFSFKKNKY